MKAKRGWALFGKRNNGQKYRWLVHGPKTTTDFGWWLTPTGLADSDIVAIASMPPFGNEG
jgi:hypothetical protein